MQRRVGLYLLLLFQPILMVSSSRQLQDLHAFQGRTLKQTAAHGKLLTDYIGASGDTSVQFTDAPRVSGVQYIFPLSFAIDADAAGNTQNGVFAPYWSTSLSQAAAASFVQANSNVRLVASLAGASQFTSSGVTRPVDWYDPPSTDEWIANAVRSISTLVSQYSLSGIDIDYETFPQGSATFTTCIGGLITQLKNSAIITVASIAPFGQTVSIYQDLFQNFGDVIDYVNYQFYGDAINSQSEFVAAFNTVAGQFDSTKILASVEADGRGLQGNDFISAAKQVAIAGIMIFDVDNSKKTGFNIENLANSYLAS